MRVLGNSSDTAAAVEELLRRRAADASQEVTAAVSQIVDRVRKEGDSALLEYERKFDCPTLTQDRLRVSASELHRAAAKVGQEFLDALAFAREAIERFHRESLPRSWTKEMVPGLTLGQKVNPIRRVGVYVPGGRASYPSTVLHTIIPARVAGCSEIAVACPPGPEGELSCYTLAAVALLEVSEVYRMGGAQAIAALAFGTQMVPVVDKVVGPGNRYVTAAKKIVFGQVGIESLAGPSEVVLLSDGSADPRWIAADLIAQAEHGPDSLVVLITTDQEEPEKVLAALDHEIQGSEREALIRASLAENGLTAVVPSLREARDLCNRLAPEHVECLTLEPEQDLAALTSAGAIFVGSSSPVAFGDYVAGPSHVLPTAGTARFSSPLHVEDFLTKSSVLWYSGECLTEVSRATAVLARAEGLEGHARSAELRVEAPTAEA